MPGPNSTPQAIDRHGHLASNKTALKHAKLKSRQNPPQDQRPPAARRVDSPQDTVSS